MAYTSILPTAWTPGQPLGPTKFGYFNDFVTRPDVSETANAAEWLMTLIDGGGDNGEVVTVSDAERGGVLRLVNNDADNDAISLQLNGEAFSVTTGNDLIFECKFKINDADMNDWMIGLSSTDTDALGGVNDFIGFRCPDNTGDIDCVTEDDTNETVTDSTINLADDTFATVQFHLKWAGDGTARVNFYVNGAKVATHTANIPDTGTALTPLMEFRNAEAAANVYEVDWIGVQQTR